jgi:hypothetical protein
MRQRVRTFMYWLYVLRGYGFNPFAAWMDTARERDYLLRWLQMTERELGYSIAPPEPSPNATSGRPWGAA